MDGGEGMEETPKFGPRKFKSLECYKLNLLLIIFYFYGQIYLSRIKIAVQQPNPFSSSVEWEISPPVIWWLDLVNTNNPIRCRKCLFQVFKFNVLVSNFDPPCSIIPAKAQINYKKEEKQREWSTSQNERESKQ